MTFNNPEKLSSAGAVNDPGVSWTVFRWGPSGVSRSTNLEKNEKRGRRRKKRPIDISLPFLLAP